MALYVALAVLVGALLVTLVVTTGLGARRRGCAIPLTILAALTFPVTWAAWYVADGRPPRLTDVGP